MASTVWLWDNPYPISISTNQHTIFDLFGNCVIEIYHISNFLLFCSYRKVYFHGLASTKEFFVPNLVLRNEKRATHPSSYYDYTYLGCRGADGQSSVEFFDKRTNVLFYTKVSKTAIGCWLTNRPYQSKAQGSIALPSYPTDVKVDQTGAMWVLSNRLPMFLNSSLSLQQFNHHIFLGNSSEIIKGKFYSDRITENL